MARGKTPATLDELRDQIREQAEFVGSRGYAHNIIAICLRMIEERFGRAEVNKAITDYDLEDAGGGHGSLEIDGKVECRTVRIGGSFRCP